MHIPHSPDAIEVTQEVANYFVSEARKNAHAAVSSCANLVSEAAKPLHTELMVHMGHVAADMRL